MAEDEEIEIVKSLLAREVKSWKREHKDIDEKWAREGNHRNAHNHHRVIFILCEVLYHLTGREFHCPKYMILFDQLTKGTFDPGPLPEPRYWETEGGP